MKLYFWLSDRMPVSAAALFAALWLAALLFLALFFAEEPSADFRYGNI